MFSIKSKKSSLFVRIDENLNEEFRKFIVKKYGEYRHGLLSLEIEQAIRYWMELHTKDTKTFLPKVSTPKVQEYFLRVQAYLREKYKIVFFPGQKLPKRLIVEAITNTFGADKRTIRKYIRLFLEYKLLKNHTPETFIICEEKSYSH